jgi:hypothetical protein
VQQECWLCGEVVEDEKTMVDHLKAEHAKQASECIPLYVQAVRRGVHTGWTRPTAAGGRRRHEC